MRAFCTAGTMTAVSVEMIDIVTTSSNTVKPRRRMTHSLFPVAPRPPPAQDQSRAARQHQETGRFGHGGSRDRDRAVGEGRDDLAKFGIAIARAGDFQFPAL